MKFKNYLALKNIRKFRKYVLFGFLLFFINYVTASEKDSTNYSTPHTPSFLKKQIVPISLLSAGALLNIGDIKYKIQDKLPNTSIHIDDYFPYAPIVEMYLADVLGCEHKNSVFDQTKYLIISHVISAATVGLLKNTINSNRPYGDPHSFPSGHTAKAFVSATVLYMEFKESAPLLAWSGYAFATATGVLRVTNNAHWVPDVLFSAGLGILTVNLVYHFEPLKNFQPFKKKKDLAFTPIIGPSSVGLFVRF
jgi:hypothetical protein